MRRDDARLRIRAAKANFAVGEPVALRYQPEYDQKSADISCINRGNFLTQVVVKIDGEPVQIWSTGLGDGHISRFPFQGDVQLARKFLKPGKCLLG